MTKLKSIPNQGSRTIHLPVVGDTKFVDGITDIEESEVGALLSHSFGFRLGFLEGRVQGQPTKDYDPEGLGFSGSGVPSIEELSALRVVDLKEFFDAMHERGVIKEGEEEEYNKMKKAERAAFIHEALQRPIIGEEGENSEEGTEE